MKSLRECLLPTSAQLIDNDPSHIYYLELLDENADSVETMSVVAEMIIEKMKTSTQESVVLVGDGKTFVHPSLLTCLNYSCASNKTHIWLHYH
jgi:hypothetical protein